MNERDTFKENMTSMPNYRVDNSKETGIDLPHFKNELPKENKEMDNAQQAKNKFKENINEDNLC
mgnify:CR=1 FL=1